MNDDWKYSPPERGRINQAREYVELGKDLDKFDAAADELLKYHEEPTLLDGVRTRIQERMALLKPILKETITCDCCSGCGREGHGENCGRCNGRGKIPLWLRVGVNPHSI